ncbi:hypothetical protein MKW92_006411 [Papaver armeniacum]|nr:hypothetical protein MKW92_006411 [Papaver armeniacum]
MPTGAISQSRVINHNYYYHDRKDRVRENLDQHESRSDTDKPPRKKRENFRHSAQQVQELEALFKECPHLHKHHINELSKRVSLKPIQIRFWFQNRRTQMQAQIQRDENLILRQENDKLRASNMYIREAIRNTMCNNCGGAREPEEVSLREQNLRVENARLREELNRVSARTGKFFSRPVSSFGDPLPPPIQLNAEFDLNKFGGNGMNQDVNGINLNLLMGNGNHQFRGGGVSGGMPSMSVLPHHESVLPHHEQQFISSVDRSRENSMYLDLAFVATKELLRMALTNEPLWIPPGSDGGREKFNHDEYMRMFTPCIGAKPNGFVSEATRETTMVSISSVALLETLMNVKQYMDMFSCVIARCNITDVISSGVGGTRNGALQLMHAEFRVLSPLVPIREVNFLRCCKQHAEGLWSVVDISVDANQETSGSSTNLSRRLPSGCLVQHLSNGYSKVTWVEHAEYEENMIHRLYKPLVNSGLGFGAQKWIATLHRQCDRLAIFMSNNPSRDQAEITPRGRASMLKLAQRMTQNFCAGVCPSSSRRWKRFFSAGNVDVDVKVMTRKSVNDPGEPTGAVMSAATSVWLPISPEKLFDFLRDERLRFEWDVLSSGGPMQQISHITTGQDPGNCISLLRSGAMNATQSNMIILQETCTDASGSLVVYAPVDPLAINNVVMSGSDSAYIELLPSGFAIVPGGEARPSSLSNCACADRANSSNCNDGSDGVCGSTSRGSLLTVALQIWVSSSSTARLTVESVETVSILISNTLKKIKAALR